MGLAGVDDDAYVLQREAGDEAVLEDVAHAFLDRRDELAGDRAALHGVDELETLAARQRLHPQEYFAALPGAPRLLLVAAVTLSLGDDGLAERDRRRMRVELDLVLRGHFFEDRLEVHLAQTPHHGLVRLRVVLDAEAGILGRDLVHPVGPLLLALAVLGH